MNILELAPMKSSSGYGSRTYSKEPVIYSWHRHTKQRAKGLCFRFTMDVLKKARYIEGDRVSFDVSDDLKVLTALIGPKGSHALSGQNTKSGGSTRASQMKYEGIDKLESIFPPKGGPVPLKVISTSDGKVVCEIPSE